MQPAKIALSGKNGLGKFALVDVEDVPLVSRFKWHITDNGYAVNRGIVNGKKTTIRMHRLIMQTPIGMDTDHKNRNRLDNQRSNLRICTRSENLFNKDGVKGYYYDSKRKRWIVDYLLIGVRWKQFKTKDGCVKFIEDKLKEKE